jgi:hypothetical protein
LPVPGRTYFRIAPGRLAVRKPDPVILTPETPVVPATPTAAVQPKPDTPRRPKVTMKDLKPDTTRRTAVKPKPAAPAETSVIRSADPAPETQLSIYFTDGRGKFYSSTPQLRLVDAATGKQVKQFYRTVDPNGNPDPQVVPAGTYNLVVATRSNIVLKKLVIEEKKNNKFVVRVNNGSLRFRYDNNPNRPVSEFDAIVNIRFEDGPVNQKQRCVDEPEYPPGNYHVEINTLPRMQQNVDIDFGAVSEIAIPEPGFVQFTNTGAIGPVQLFSPLGNRFMRFYGLRVNGAQEAQRVRLLPGVYEVHWVTNAGTPRAKEEVMRFNIQSNKETLIELN